MDSSIVPLTQAPHVEAPPFVDVACCGGEMQPVAAYSMVC